VAAQPAGDAEWAATVAAAEQEGVLTMAGPPMQPYRLSIMQFEKAYPKIRVEYSGLSPAEFEARINSERRAGLSLWDLRIAGVSSTAFSDQIPAGWYEPIRPLIVRPEVLDDAKWLGGFDAGFMDNAKQYVYAFQAGAGGNIYVDRRVIPVAELNSLEGLFEPKWKGKIAMLDPRQRGAGNFVPLVLVKFGEEKARAFLVSQEPVITPTSRQLVDWAMSGRYPITMGMSPSDHADRLAKGIGKGVEPLILPPHQAIWTVGWGTIMRVAKAPHPNAAKVFVNWILSRDAQADWAKRGFVNSRRTDVEPGLEDSRIDAATMLEGLTFNSEKNADAALQGARIARDVLK